MRPVIKIPRSTLEKVLEVISLICLVTMVILIITFWNRLPNEIAIHFDITGKVDGWGRKETLLLFPALGVFLYVLLSITALHPHKYNYLWEITEENAKRQYQLARTLIAAIKAEELALFVAITWSSIEISLGLSPQLQLSIIFTALSVIGSTVGLYFIKAHMEK